MKRFFLLLLLAGLVLGVAPAQSDNSFHCEVLSVQGQVRIYSASGSVSVAKEGDLLSDSDSVEIADDGALDLAYDKDWNNVVRLEGGTRAKVLTVSPAKLELTEGAIYAKLKQLPRESSFEVRTPTAVAAVRGTEYRTLVRDEKTEVFNFSPSRVYVYGVDAAGAVGTTPLVLEKEQKTNVAAKGEEPDKPAPMAAAEIKICEAAQASIESGISRANTEGRVGKIQTVNEIEQALSAAKSRARYDEESRVTDSRRRAFK